MPSILAELVALGVSAQIDDFGTGYSSLTSLQHFQGDAVKIDRAFIASMGEDGGGAAIVRAVIALAHNLDLRVVAEGVETKAQLEDLRSLGCDFAQGFLFSRPLDAATAASLIQTWNEGGGPGPLLAGHAPRTAGLAGAPGTQAGRRRPDLWAL